MDLTIPYIVSLLGWSLLSAKVQILAELIDHVCANDSSLCYYLYKDQRYLGLSEAIQECRKRGQSLATLLDTKSQILMAEMGYKEEDQLAWLSANISSNSEWRTLDGQLVSNLNYEPGTNYRCSAYRAFEDHFTFFATPCKIGMNSSLRLSVCQIPPQKGMCPNGSKLLLDTCYAIPTNWTYTAFDGNTLCSHLYPNSTLAYSHVESNDFQVFVYNELSVFKTIIEMWMGVFSKPWVWLLNSSGSVIKMQTANWQTGFGTAELGSCLSVNLKNDKTWQNIDCSRKLDRYLCQGPKEDVSSTNNSTTPSTNTNAVIIAIVVAAVISLIILIASIVIYLRCSPKKRKSVDNDHELKEGQVHSIYSVRNSEMSSEVDKTNRDLDLIDINLASNSTRFKAASYSMTTENIFMTVNQ